MKKFATKLGMYFATHESVIVPIGRGRKIRTALRTNQIEGLVTVPPWKKNNDILYCTTIRLRDKIFKRLTTTSPISSVLSPFVLKVKKEYHEISDSLSNFALLYCLIKRFHKH